MKIEYVVSFELPDSTPFAAQEQISAQLHADIPQAITAIHPRPERFRVCSAWLWQQEQKLIGKPIKAEPPWETFKNPTCRGCYALGTACGHCEKCEWEQQQRR